MESLPACLSKFSRMPCSIICFNIFIQRWPSSLLHCHPDSESPRQTQQFLDSRLHGPFRLHNLPGRLSPADGGHYWNIRLFHHNSHSGKSGFCPGLAGSHGCRSGRYFTPDRLLPAAGIIRRQALSGGIWKMMSAQLRNKGILLFAIIGIISCAIDIITLPFPIPELPPGSPLSAATMIPLPPEVPLKYASPPVSRPGFPENAILTRPSGKGWRQTRFPRHFDQSRGEKHRYHLQAVAGGQASSGQPDFH